MVEKKKWIVLCLMSVGTSKALNIVLSKKNSDKIRLERYVNETCRETIRVFGVFRVILGMGHDGTGSDGSWQPIITTTLPIHPNVLGEKTYCSASNSQWWEIWGLNTLDWTLSMCQSWNNINQVV